MTLFMVFAGLGIPIYLGLAYAETAFSNPSSAFFAFLSNLLAALFLFSAYRLLRVHSSSVYRAVTWRRRIAVVALVLCAGGVAALIAATRNSGEASSVPPHGPQAAEIDGETTSTLEAGRTLFQERGCIGCHRPDGAGVGPTLYGRLGSPVEYPGSGAAVADEAYLRESILNPTATVAAGFPPVMPTFAGRLTEEELHALVVYVESLSTAEQAQGQ